MLSAQVGRDVLGTSRDPEPFELLDAALGSVEPSKLWVNPDCGLKTRAYAEVEPSLRNLVTAAIEQRARATAQ